MVKLNEFIKNPIIVLIIILGAINLITYFAITEGTNTFDLITGISYDINIALCVFCLFYVSRFYGRKNVEGQVWLYLSVAMILWLIAEIFWLYYVLSDLEPYPSIADIFFIGGYIPLFLSVVRKLRFSKVHMVFKKNLAIATIVGIILVPSLVWVGAPIYNDPGYGATEKFVGLLYPLLDIVLLAIALFIAFYWGPTISKGWYFIAASFAFFTLADISFTALDWADHQILKLELLWVAGYSLLAAGAIYQKMHHESFM